MTELLTDRIRSPILAAFSFIILQRVFSLFDIKCEDDGSHSPVGGCPFQRIRDLG
jgi:hypothetical protein